MKNVYKEKVSILLPTFNSEDHISQTLLSIVNQDYPNLELIIIDNYSTDNTINKIKSFETKLDIKIFQIDTNNLAEALNFGIKKSSGEFIARIDSDDLIRKKRISKQVFFLKNNLNYHIVGTNALRFKSNSFYLKPFLINYDNEDLKISMIFNSPFIHPTIMIRADFVRTNAIQYDSKFNECEDFKLWYDLLNLTKFKNLKYYGIFYRVHDKSASFKKRDELNKYYKIINRKIINDYNINLSDDEIFMLNKISSLDINPKDDFEVINSYYIRILNKIHISCKKKFNDRKIKIYLNKKYIRFCLRSIHTEKFNPKKVINSYFKLNFLEYSFLIILYYLNIRV